MVKRNNNIANPYDDSSFSSFQEEHMDLEEYEQQAMERPRQPRRLGSIDSNRSGVRRQNSLMRLRIDEEQPGVEEGVALHISPNRQRRTLNISGGMPGLGLPVSPNRNARVLDISDRSGVAAPDRRGPELESMDLHDLLRVDETSGAEYTSSDSDTEVDLNDETSSGLGGRISRHQQSIGGSSNHSRDVFSLAMSHRSGQSTSRSGHTPSRSGHTMSQASGHRSAMSFGSSWDSMALRRVDFSRGEKATPRLIKTSGTSHLRKLGESMSTFRSMNLSKHLSFDFQADSAKDFVSYEDDEDFEDEEEDFTKYSEYEDDLAVADPNAEPTRKEKMDAFMKTADDWTRRKIQWVYLFVAMYMAPISIALWAPQKTVTALYFTSIGAIIFVNTWMFAEVVMSFSYTARCRKLHHSRPEIKGERRLGSIIAAYLPNELTVLVDTVKAISNTIHELPEGTTLDIVLSHNGGKKHQRIELLQSLRTLEPLLPPNVMVHELNVLSSTSKAENVNAALGFFEELGNIRGEEFTQLSMYDADHQPIPQAWRYALETMQDQKADMVMGRCCVQDGLKYIAIEFDILYGVAHAGGRCVRGFGFFGGSNGYWDYQTLQETGMDEGMLTEDVDSSFRAQAAGHYMTYDSTIVSFEESPPDFQALFKQRLRWAQGWYEVTLRQITLPFRKAPGLTLWSRFCIFLVLPFREVYVYLSSFTVPIAIVYLIRTGCGLACIDYGLLGLMGFCLTVPILMTFAAWYLTHDKVLDIHYRMPTLTPRDYYRYIFISYPYELFKIHVTVMGHARQALSLNKWVVTKRKSTGKPAEAKKTPDDQIEDPESLIKASPFAPNEMGRKMFTGTFDEKRKNAQYVHNSTEKDQRKSVLSDGTAASSASDGGDAENPVQSGTLTDDEAKSIRERFDQMLKSALGFNVSAMSMSGWDTSARENESALPVTRD